MQHSPCSKLIEDLCVCTMDENNVAMPQDPKSMRNLYIFLREDIRNNLWLQSLCCASKIVHVDMINKLWFVKNILQNVKNLCEPVAERIIWLYKRWQPMYDEIKTTVWPKVEFEQGIPLDIEKDSYLDPSVRNMIVLDDLMSTAAKDPRITDLFTEGSHHRNLSVVVLNQNLYFSKDPTQRRNCHYLFLFKNPLAKQSVTGSLI